MVVAVEDLAVHRGLGDGAGRLLLHVVPVVYVGDEDEGETGALGVLASDAGVLVAGDGVEPGRVDEAHPEPGVGAGVVGVVHLVGVHGRQDGAEVRPLGGDGHAAVDERAAADSAALVDDDAAHFLGVEDARVLGHGLVDRESEEVAERRLGLGAQPVGAVVGIGGVGEDLAVAAGGVPGHAHLDHVDVDAGLGQAQGGDGSAVSGTDHQDRDAGPVVDGGGGGGLRRVSGGDLCGEGHGPQNRTCSRKESATGESAVTVSGHAIVTHVTFLTLGLMRTSSTATCV